MKVGELFVNLGIKGGDTAKKALSGVKDGLGEVKSLSFETKAAIVGAIYALERLMSSSAQTGANLENFNALTGIGIQQLQKWQYAARQVNVSNEEMAGSFKNVQNNVASLMMGKSGIEGYAMVASKVGLDKSLMRGPGGTEYVLNQLQKFAQWGKEHNAEDITNQMIRSFGVSDNVIGAMRRNAFTPEIMNKAPTYSNNEVKSLDHVNAMMGNLQNKIAMAMGHFTSRHGEEMINGITKITDAVLFLVEALVELGEKLGVFKLLGDVISDTSNLVGDAANGAKDQKSDKRARKDVETFKQHFPRLSQFLLGSDDELKKVYSSMKQPPGSPSGTKHDVTMNQTVNIHNDSNDPHKTADAVKRAVKHSYRQMSAQGQSN